MLPLETGKVATVLGWRRFLRFSRVGIGFAVVESVRATRARRDHIEGMMMAFV